MRNKIAVILISFIMITGMVPVYSFAEEVSGSDPAEDLPGMTEQAQPAEGEESPEPADAEEVAEPDEPDELVEPDEADASAIQEEPEGMVKAKATTVVEPDFPGEATVEDTSQYTSSMRIYSIYLRRASGSANSKDRYGDATLIESNGKFLLIDTGAKCPVKSSSAVHHSNLVKVLKQIGVKELDVYISHMHGDHQGGLAKVCESFQVNKLYLPDIETCKKYETPNAHKPIQKIYNDQVRIANDEGAEVVYLSPSFRKHTAANTYSYFTVGAVKGSVIGPVGTYKISDFKKQDGKYGSMEGHYLNNCSLVTIFTCGKFRFLAAGDVETKEEGKLVAKYGTKLNCNMMKLNHHGMETSNSAAFIAKVTPMWSFAQDHGYTVSVDGPVSRARDYGYSYRVGSKKHTLIVEVKNNKTRLYIDSNNNAKTDEKPLTGWIASKKQYQFYDKAGYIKLGWGDIGGKKYYMSGSSGFRFTGTHTIKKVKCKFDKNGKLTNIKKPTKTKLRSVKAKKGHKIKIRWKKASRASRYQVYRSTNSKTGFVLISTRAKKSRSFKDKNLEAGKTYYYKVRAIRYKAGTTFYGSFSKVKHAKAK